MNASQVVYLVPIVAVLALIYAMIRAAWVQRQDPGNERMQIIGQWIADGAMAFLKREYRALAIFVVAVAAVLAVSNAMVGAEQQTNGLIAVSFVLGAFCSALAGFIGMKTATAANIRTAAAARHGLTKRSKLHSQAVQLWGWRWQGWRCSVWAGCSSSI